MKTSHLNALQSTIFFLILSFSPLCGYGGDIPTGAQGVNRAGIFFEMPDYPRLLEDLESCSGIREKNAVLSRLNEKNEQLEEIRIEREKLLRERIGFLEAQQGELLRMNDQAIKTAELARKAGGGTWYEQLFTAGKWIGLGIALGFVAGAAK